MSTTEYLRKGKCCTIQQKQEKADEMETSMMSPTVTLTFTDYLKSEIKSLALANTSS